MHLCSVGQTIVYSNIYIKVNLKTPKNIQPTIGVKIHISKYHPYRKIKAKITNRCIYYKYNGFKTNN